MYFIRIILLCLLSFSFFFAAEAQKSKGENAAAYKIYEDLPLDEPGRKSVLNPKDNTAEKIKANIFIETSFSKTTCFIGEPILVTYQLYSALMNESKVSRNPSFQGFTVQRIASSNEESVYKKIGDKNFRVFTADKCILTPYETGILKLDPIAITNTVSYEDDNGEKKEYAGEVTGQTTVISVLPLPAKGKPASFSGGVGKFSVIVKTDKTEISVNDNFHIQVEVSGVGNLSDFSFATVTWPPAFEVVETKEKLNTDSAAAVFFVRKTFIVSLVAKKEGTYTIGPFQMTCFNPQEGKYENMISKPVQLTVNKSSAAQKPERTSAQQATTAHRNNWLYAVSAALLVIVVTAILLRQKTLRVKAVAKKMSEISEVMVVNKPVEPDYETLIKAAALQVPATAFIGAFKEVISQYLTDKTMADSSKYPDEMLIDKLALSDPAKAAAIKDLTAACNRLLYSPGSINENTRVSMTDKFLAVLNKEMLPVII